MLVVVLMGVVELRSTVMHHLSNYRIFLATVKLFIQINK